VRYNELTRRYFEDPPSAGTLEGPRVFRGAAGSRSRGTWVQFDLELAARSIAAQDDVPVIADARFAAFGCPHVIAVAAWLAEHARGRQVEPGLPESIHLLRARFEAPVEKLGRLLIVEDAWLAAMRLAGQPHV
jgi:NifU-like protein involved in Fe-S cluster formation